MAIEGNKNQSDLGVYIINSLSKIRHKPWELFVISRIIHGICKDHPDIQFVCQQLVSLPDNKRALTDIYFPNLKIHLEVDETHHTNEVNRRSDEMRDQDIIDAIRQDIINNPNNRDIISLSKDSELKRISNHQKLNNKVIIKNIDEIINEVDDFIEFLKFKKQDLREKGVWQGWDFGARFDPATYRSLGKLRVEDGPAFRTHKAALECFGYEGGHYQRSVWNIPRHSEGKKVWFPKLYNNNDWRNELSPDGKIITYSPTGENVIEKYEHDYSFRKGVIIFTHYRDSLGLTLYRYLGEFIETDFDENTKSVTLVQTSVETNLNQWL